MAENQIIGATIQVDTGNSNQNVAELNKGTSTLKGNLKDVGATMKGTSKDVGLTGENFSKLKSQISALPGPTKNLTEGIGGVNQAFNILRANPIIGVFALIAGLVIALFQKFQKMEAVSDSLGKAFGVLSGLLNTFLNAVLTPLIKAFTFLVDVFTDTVTFIADIFSPGLSEAAKRSGELAEALDDLSDAEAQSAISRAESNRKLQEAKELAEDANIPIQDRIKALQEAGKIEKEEFDKSIEIATQRAKIMLEQIAIELGARKELISAIRNGSLEQLKAARNEIYAMENVDKEKLKAIDALIIQAENEGAQRSKVNKKTESQITALQKEEEDKRKKVRDDAESKRKAAQQKADTERKAEQQKLNQFNSKLQQLQQDNELSQIKDGYQKELRELELKLENEKKANEQAVKDRNLTRAQAEELNAELEKQSATKRAALTDKHNREIAEKEAAFQKELYDINLQIRIANAAALSEAEIHKIEETQKKKFDIELSGFKESFEAEKKALEQRTTDEKSLNEQAFRDHKISKDQLRKLNADLDSKLRTDQIALQEKFNSESFGKEQQFQKDLDALVIKAKADRLKESRRIEREQLETGYNEALADAEKRYQDDAEKLAQIKAAIDEKNRQDQKKLDEKYEEEDRKAAQEKAQKELDEALKGQDEIIGSEVNPDDPSASFDAKRAAVEAEQELLQKAFDDKVITEELYTDRVKQLAEKRMQIAELETEHKKAQTQEMASVLSGLANLVGKQTVAGKALGIATALINTYQGATEALKQKSVLPSPFDVVAKVANVATVIATGLKTVKSIASVSIPGGGGGGSTPGVSPAAPLAPTQASTKLDADSINGIGNAAAGGVNRTTTRAYVLNGDIQSESEREARLQRAATLGG